MRLNVSDADGSIISADGGGIVGNLAPRARVVLPLAREKEHNTIRPTIFPIACWKADDVNFDFDSSFVRPGVAVQTPRFRALMEQHPGAPLPADAKEREPRLLAALIEGTNILRRYAIAAVGPRAMVARGKGVDLLSRAIASGKTDEDADLALADPLSDTPLFLPEQGEDMLNVRIVTVLASRMIEADAQLAPTWLGYISNCVMTELGVAEGGEEAGQEGEDGADAAKRESAVRTRLIRGVDVPNKAMISRLEKLIAAADGNSEIAAKLNTAWISANGR